MNIAFVLLTYGVDEPAGIEHSIAGLAAGVAERGHHVVIVTAGSTRTPDAPGIRPLRSVQLPRPAVEGDLLKILADPGPVCAEVHALLLQERIDVVCWADASWGLGFLAPAPPGVRTVLRLGVLRTDEIMMRALAAGPDRVFTCSRFLIQQAMAAGIATAGWHAVPDPLARPGVPPPNTDREQLRRLGPIRLAVRAEPQKGIAALIGAAPARLDRPVEIAIAPAAFEYWPGMQDYVIADARVRAHGHPGIAICPALPWHDVQPFFADAAATIVCSTEPETFCLAAAEALSVGTPVIAYDLGYVPTLVGDAGLTVPIDLGPRALWTAVTALLDDSAGYHRASAAAPARVARLTPAAVADAFLAAIS